MLGTRWLAMGALALVVVGCDGGTRPPASQLAQGMNILDARADTGITAAFVKGSRVIYIETRVGPLKPEAYRLDAPDEPAHEIDVRYVDQVGNTFLAQRGGDEFIDATWSAEIAKLTSVSKADREADFAMAVESAGAMERANLPASMHEHVFSAAAQGRLVPSAFPELAQRAAEIEAKPHDNTLTNWYWQEADVYNKCVALCAGLHHAVYGWNYNNQTGTWDQALNTCNHGTCAGSMSYVCYTNSGWKTYPLTAYFSGEYSQSTGTVSGACSTSYNWWTGSGTHNSNDDAWYEMWQIYNGTQGSRSSQAGYDQSGNYYACNCAAGCNDWVHTLGCYPSH